MQLFAQLSPMTALVLAGVGLTVSVLLVRTQRQLRQTADQEPASLRMQRRSDPARVHNLAAPEDVRRWEVQMHEMIRETTAKFQTQAALLEQMLETAAEQTAKLEAVVARAEALAAVSPPGKTNRPDLTPVRLDRARAVDQAVSALAAVPPPHVHSQAAELARPSRPAPRAAAMLDQAAMRSRDEIFRLADAGIPASDIASRLASPVGEIELILGLRQANNLPKAS